VCLLPLLFAGCSHKPQQEPLAPPIEDAPPPKPLPSPTTLPPPVITIPKETPEPSSVEPPKPALAPPARQKKHTPPPSTTQQAPIARPSVSAIGQLSSGDPSDLRRQTVDSIASTERGMNGIHRSLNEQEKKTASQIKEYLKQAHAALNSGDVDGAHTLAAKAKVLLGELSQ
jgi:outer membrane biosynthesis protein TonB